MVRRPSTPPKHHESHHSTQGAESRSRPRGASPVLRKRTFQRHHFRLDTLQSGTTRKPRRRSARRNPWLVKSTPLWARTCKPPFESPRGCSPPLDWRAIRWSHFVHGERAQCELHDKGPVVPIRNHRQDVPSVRFGGRDDAHLQDFDLRPPTPCPRVKSATFEGRYEDARAPSAAAPGAVAGSNQPPVPGRRWQSQLAVGRSEEHPAAEGDVLPVQGVFAPGCSFRGGAQTTRDREQLLFMDGTTRPPRLMKPPFDLQRKGSGGGGAHTGDEEGGSHVELSGGDAGGTANREGHPRHFLRKRQQMSVKAHRDDGRPDDRNRGTTMASSPTTFAFRPLTQVPGVVDEGRTVTCGTTTPGTGANGSPPRSRPNNTKVGRRDQSKLRSPCTDRVGCPADLLLGAPWVHFVSEKVYQEVSPREPGENDSACDPKFLY